MTNKFTIEDRYEPNLTHIQMLLTPATELVFTETVFPFLLDGKTSGSRSREKDGRVCYNFLVYDSTLAETFKQVLANAIMRENGQLN